MFLCYRLTKTFDVLPFSIQTHYSSKVGIPKETSLEFKYSVVHVCVVTPQPLEPKDFQHCRQPISAFGGGENPVPIFLQMRHDHTFTYTYKHTRTDIDTHSATTHLEVSVFPTWLLSTTSLLMSDHTGSYTLGYVPHQTVHPFGHIPLCSSLSP